MEILRYESDEPYPERATLSELVFRNKYPAGFSEGEAARYTGSSKRVIVPAWENFEVDFYAVNPDFVIVEWSCEGRVTTAGPFLLRRQNGRCVELEDISSRVFSLEVDTEDNSDADLDEHEKQAYRGAPTRSINEEQHEEGHPTDPVAAATTYTDRTAALPTMNEDDVDGARTNTNEHIHDFPEFISLFGEITCGSMEEWMIPAVPPPETHESRNADHRNL